MGATFEQWIDSVFEHKIEKPEWYWDQGFDTFWDSLRLTDALTVRYMTHLFLNSQQLKRYSLPQVAQGIWFLVGESSPGASSYALLKPSVDLTERVTCVHTFVDFFRGFVAPVASGPANEDSDPFHMACYMWWDIFPSYGGPQAGEPELHSACIDAMVEILDVPSELCRLSALHGLNHWHLHYSSRVEKIVDEFLQHAGDLTKRVRAYAENARVGACQ